MSFNPADYAEVAERLPLFWKDCPLGRINTEIITDDGTRIVMKATLWADISHTVPTTTGFAEEIRGSSMVNKTSALENCETSAIGRALANYQFQGSKKRASLEEMVKVYRHGEQAVDGRRLDHLVEGGFTTEEFSHAGGRRVELERGMDRRIPQAPLEEERPLVGAGDARREVRGNR
jgi:hypothetical protein